MDREWKEQVDIGECQNLEQIINNLQALYCDSNTLPVVRFEFDGMEYVILHAQDFLEWFGE